MKKSEYMSNIKKNKRNNIVIETLLYSLVFVMCLGLVMLGCYLSN